MAEYKGFGFYKTNSSGRTGLVANGSQLTLYGQPLRIVSGAIHYFRVVPEYWKDRLLKLKACGCNCVETYVAWNLHEPLPGEFNFQGICDIRKFIEIAAELDLLVIFRPGPYICAEWEFGGLPSWLLHDEQMRVRTTYPPFMAAVDRFFSHLIPQMTDLQFSENGPVILVQIENEYGAYGCDQQYMDGIADLLKKHGIKELLFTSDGPEDLEKGHTSSAINAWMTVNEQTNMGWVLDRMTEVQPDRPLMVTEYWTGWFDHWNEKRHTVPLETYASELKTILSRGASVNFFMFHGGTSFGFMNGANAGLKSAIPYQPTITSYDYDCLVSENGALTPKWFKTREILAEFGLLAKDLPVVADLASKDYGQIRAIGWTPFRDFLQQNPRIEVSQPLPMECWSYKKRFGQAYGFIAYEKEIPNLSGELIIEEFHDRAVILIDDWEMAVLDYTVSAEKNHKIQIEPAVSNGSKSVRLTILVENMGRVNFVRAPKTLDDQRKGLMGGVTLNGEALTSWTVHPVEFLAKDLDTIFSPGYTWKTVSVATPSVPGLFKFDLEVLDEPKDTFLNVEGWGRGVAFVNGFNLGRYWPSAGPQRTLYLPGPLLRQGVNTVVLFELHTCGAMLCLCSEPILG